MKPNTVAIRKRGQIAKANRTMFIWIAMASVLVGSAGVVSYFLVQKLIFNEKVLAAQQETVDTLSKNNAAIAELENKIRVLDTNTDLSSVKANPDDRTIQVILDALPSDANSLALGASLQNKLLNGIPGLIIETLKVEPVVGVETLAGADALAVITDEGNANAINFQFTVTGNQDQLKQVLTNLERSIRTIEVVSLRIETKGDKQSMSVIARAFYEPKRTIQLQDKLVKP